MKSKFVKYLLIAGVSLVWSLIIYRVIDTTSGDAGFKTPASIPGVNIYNYPSQKKYILVKQYADPFLKEYAPKDLVITAKDTMQRIAPPPPVDMSFIKYLGMVSNIDKNRKVGMLSINGVDYMVGEGDEVQGVKVVRVREGEVQVRYMGKKGVVKRI